MHPRIAGWVSEQRDTDGLRRLAGRITNEREADRIGEFADDLELMARMASTGAGTAALVTKLIDGLGLGGTVASLDDSRRGMNRAAQGDDLTAIRQLATLHDDPTNFESWLRGHLATPRSADGVVLATVHRVKGQEWPVVIVHLADDDQFPHRLADDVEEERRLFHVAMTRTSSQVTVVAGARPSPFVAELTTEPPPPGATPPPRPAIRSAGPPDRRSVGRAPTGVTLGPRDAPLFEALKVWRSGARGDKPAYTVFADATLGAIAAARPASLAELARVKGVGPAKLEQYGDEVLGILADHTEA
jgi:DNA helicase-2/ATP-dependent DNA helicase PcrA